MTREGESDPHLPGPGESQGEVKDDILDGPEEAEFAYHERVAQRTLTLSKLWLTANLIEDLVQEAEANLDKMIEDPRVLEVISLGQRLGAFLDPPTMPS